MKKTPMKAARERSGKSTGSNSEKSVKAALKIPGWKRWTFECTTF